MTKLKKLHDYLSKNVADYDPEKDKDIVSIISDAVFKLPEKSGLLNISNTLPKFDFDNSEVFKENSCMIIYNHRAKTVTKIIRAADVNTVRKFLVEIIITKTITRMELPGANHLVPFDNYDCFMITNLYDINAQSGNPQYVNFCKDLRQKQHAMVGYTITAFDLNLGLFDVFDPCRIARMLYQKNKDHIDIISYHLNCTTQWLKHLIWKQVVEYNVVHNDLHPANIMFRRINEKEYELGFIDYEHALFILPSIAIEKYQQMVCTLVAGFFFQNCKSHNFYETTIEDHYHPEYVFMHELYNRSNLRPECLVDDNGNIIPPEMPTFKPDIDLVMNILNNYPQ